MTWAQVPAAGPFAVGRPLVGAASIYIGHLIEALVRTTENLQAHYAALFALGLLGSAWLWAGALVEIWCGGTDCDQVSYKENTAFVLLAHNQDDRGDHRRLRLLEADRGEAQGLQRELSVSKLCS